jgi:hypothetical protein
MEEGVLWRTDVMEGPCAVARGEDINNISMTLYIIYVIYMHMHTCTRYTCVPGL